MVMYLTINNEEVRMRDAIEDNMYELLVDINRIHLYVLHFIKTVAVTLFDDLHFIVIKKK